MCEEWIIGKQNFVLIEGIYICVYEKISSFKFDYSKNHN